MPAVHRRHPHHHPQPAPGGAQRPSRSGRPQSPQQESGWVSFSTPKKVAYVAGGLIFATFVGVAALFVGGAFDRKPGVQPLNLRDIQPLSSEGFKTFPPNLPRYVHPQWMTNDLGNRACDLSWRVPSPEQCDTLSELAEDAVEKLNPEFYRRTMSDSTIAKERGQPIKLPENPLDMWFSFGLEARQMRNHEKALSYLEREVLQDPEFFHRSVAEIEEVFKETHRLMTQNLLTMKDCGECAPGKYRKENMVVFPETMDGETKFEKMASMGTPSEVRVLKKFFKLWEQHPEDATTVLEQMTEAEQEIVEIFMHVPPKYEKISKKIKAFIKEFKKLGLAMEAKKEDPLYVAAWVHNKIGAIHPFGGDGQGRVARAWSYAIERRGGYEPVPFFNDDTYTEWLKKGARKFAYYIRKQIAERRAAGIKI